MDEIKKTLRQQILQQRKSLSRPQIESNSQQACEQIINSTCFKNAQHIGLYYPVNGELSPLPLLDVVSKQFYLPRIEQEQMEFVHFSNRDCLKNNQYGIPEPSFGEIIDKNNLDLVIVPLVAADRQGNRLGMGKGYYDRCFQKRQAKPLLIGVAHDFQIVQGVPTAAHDVILDAIVTETQFLRWDQ